MWAALVALWLGAAGPLFPDLPPTTITYFGPERPSAARPDGLTGLRTKPAERATAILFRGAFDIGSVDLLRTALDAAPQVRLVEFDSPGGRPLDSDAVGSLIRSRHLDTAVEHFCASACTMAFAAGTIRTAGPDAEFAFHLGTGPVLAGMLAGVIVQMERRWFVRGGVSLTFADRALHAPNINAYRPQLDELMAAGYIHRVLGPPQKAVPVPAGLLTAVAAIEPQTGASIVSTEDALRMQPPASRLAAAEQKASLVVDRWFARSSDVADLGLVDARLAALDWLDAKDPALCMQWQVDLWTQYVALEALPQGLRTALLSAESSVLVDANAYPAVDTADDGSLAQADAAVRRAVATAYGPRALANAATPEHGLDNPAQSCAAGIAYLRGLRNRPEGVRLLRWALAAG